MFYHVHTVDIGPQHPPAFHCEFSGGGIQLDQPASFLLQGDWRPHPFDAEHVLPDSVDLAIQGLGLVVALREHLLRPPRRGNIRGVMNDLDSPSAGTSARLEDHRSIHQHRQQIFRPGHRAAFRNGQTGLGQYLIGSQLVPAQNCDRVGTHRGNPCLVQPPPPLQTRRCLVLEHCHIGPGYRNGGVHFCGKQRDSRDLGQTKLRFKCIQQWIGVPRRPRSQKNDSHAADLTPIYEALWVFPCQTLGRNGRHRFSCGWPTTRSRFRLPSQRTT